MRQHRLLRQPPSWCHDALSSCSSATSQDFDASWVSHSPSPGWKDTARLIVAHDLLNYSLVDRCRYTQNAAIFSKRVAAIRKACQRHCDMVFVDAPHVIEVPSTATGAFEQFDSAAVTNHTEDTDPALIPRAWWRMKEQVGLSGETQLIYQGFDQSMAFLRQVIDNQGPFAACFGFSQGAAMAAILGSVVERPSLCVAFSHPPMKEQLPFKAVILIAGFKISLPDKLYGDGLEQNQKLTTRSLHVLGRTDAIVGEDRSLPLVEAFLNPRVVWHDGGHFVPAKKNWRDFFSSYFQNLDDPNDSLVPNPESSNENMEGPKI
ncbi:hypothetical protein O181_086275 [Austropuccinia psidii MF-1]|uniref:Serine hydrolase domain-containing protein n=1 Tax=Austropuccinia psidii MF-1 TaxID=1389203 RepID=A0A9Q3FZ06_9BASI|nr:hypothetical protein [Austropuccinia psidii MF-1]